MLANDHALQVRGALTKLALTWLNADACWWLLCLEPMLAGGLPQRLRQGAFVCLPRRDAASELQTYGLRNAMRCGAWCGVRPRKCGGILGGWGERVLVFPRGCHVHHSLVRKEPPLLRHMERLLGRFERAWKCPDHAAVSVLQFGNAPEDGVVTIATFGISLHNLTQRSGQHMRQEVLLTSVGSPNRVDDMVSRAMDACDTILGGHAALPRGKVLGPRGPLGDNTSLEALFCWHAAAFPEELDKFEFRGQPVVFAWLAPISPAEAEYVHSHGHQAFEALLLEQEPDLFDWSRAELPVCKQNTNAST